MQNLSLITDSVVDALRCVGYYVDYRQMEKRVTLNNASDYRTSIRLSVTLPQCRPIVALPVPEITGGTPKGGSP